MRDDGNVDQGWSGGGGEKCLGPGCSIVKAKETKVIEVINHLQGLRGPGFEPRYSDSRSQFSSEVHCYKPQSTIMNYFKIITCLFSVYF